METRSSKRRRIAQILENEANSAIDRISDLPDDVLHQILFLVPIKCVAQMSVLSKRWKLLWSTFPDLDFTTLNPFDISSKNLKFSTPMDFITQVLSVRDKHSDIRVLCFRGGLGFSRLNSLFRSAIKHNVRELDIEVTTSVTKDDYFNFPRCVIGSESLRVLKLKSGFRLPPSSIMRDGFQSLHTLSLSLVILYNQPYLSDLFSESSFPLLKNLHLDMCFGLKYLHVGCRGLKDLSLDKCFQLHGLDISCAKLEKMRVTSSFDAYSKKSWVRINAPKLEHLFWQHNAVSDTTVFEQSNFLREAYVGFFAMKGAIGMDKVHSVNSFLSGLSHAGSMVLESQTIEILSNKNFFIPPFRNLKSLELNIGFSKSNVRGLACLFRSSLMLHTLIMKIIKDYKIEKKQWNSGLWDMTSIEEEQYWESQIPSLMSFLEHLKVVKIHRFFECESEVTLAMFLLKHGKALEEMILCAGRCNGDTLRRQKIRSQMMGFSWASSNVKLAFH
ncbi:PREDICTED: putative F-box/FBD/LRR-repeat protein At4g03220 isoform X2 [Lupinus angustifolius]|uniref:putative F-box/FBD/LRR-repeat protein At4g03220 isoform X2 n=1 Tax=Lupinus angustifolius TaxID=3871 RepID=UPI00092F6E27|nr:PREDICTED: putative F-box/FBD/LRR-repeat protein At4g03220 isoform X2 [Lupinus angustifolius]